MAVNQDELDRFHRFATERIGDEGADSIYELLSEWETESLTDDQLQRNAQAIQKAIDDMDAGDSGRPARELIAEFRNKAP